MTPYQVAEAVVVVLMLGVIHGILGEANHSLPGYARLLVIGVLVAVAVICFASVYLGSNSLS